MKTAEEMNQALNQEPDLDYLLKKECKIFEEKMDELFDLIEDPEIREKYKGNSLYSIGKDNPIYYSKEHVAKFAEFVKGYGYIVYQDPLYIAITVYPSSKNYGNPYRSQL